MPHLTHKPSFLLRAAGVACALVSASALPAQTPDFFPLAVGNTWLYKTTRSAIANSVTYQTVRVTGTEKIGDRQYFDVSYFGRNLFLREEASTGDVFLYDRTARKEMPWVSLGLAVGGTFASSLDMCSTHGQIVSRDSKVSVQAGDFTGAIQARFVGNCADAGVTSQYYAPNVGLIQQEQTSFAGPVILQLTYYRAGSQTGGGGEASFTVAVDSPRYLMGTTLGTRLTLRNNGLSGINLHFPSGQSFDLKILNDKGEAAYTWSSDKSFIAMVHDEQLGPGELSFGVTAPLDGLPIGRYLLQAYLTTDPIAYQGQIPFEIVAPTEKN